MGKNLNALIVKNKQTALEVISYLKTLRIPPEVILPLDTIKVYPIQGKLRFVNGKQGLICLLFIRGLPTVNSNQKIPDL
jgi:chromosome segregation ATPase